MESNKKTVLIIDDEPDILELLSITLDKMGLLPVMALDVGSAILKLKSGHYDLCLTDLRLPDGTGLDVVQYIQKSTPTLPVAVISAHGNMETAIDALKSGAFDFISKPIELSQLRELVETAISLTSDPQTPDNVQLLGISSEMESIREQISKLARSMAPVHIHGESGTGKELVARLIHSNGPHAEHRFIAINCSAVPPDLMESEFFGHTKGSFTGAVSDKPGLFEAADGGTLFLDEIADLPMPMQAKLLRAIQERAIRPVGSHSEKEINCRILSATHKSLAKLVSEGVFREDLYYRINVIELVVPPLREHLEDLPLLSEHALKKIAARNRTSPSTLSDEALSKIMQYNFPGNIRELENILERSSALSDGEIQADDIVLKSRPRADTLSLEHSLNEPLDDYLARVERELIVKALQANRHSITRTAEALGISFRSLRYKMKKLDLSK
jgi:two-component system response regulator PilR (NtrC family)